MGLIWYQNLVFYSGVVKNGGLFGIFLVTKLHPWGNLVATKIPNKNTDQVKKCQSQSVTKKWGISGSKFGISKQNTLRKSNKIFETDRKRPIALISS